MKHFIFVGLMLLVLISTIDAQKPSKEKLQMKITPILFVPAIEPTLKFWVDRLGFAKTVEVPEGNKIGFVILVKDQSELMLQTISGATQDLSTSVKDPEAFKEFLRPTSGLFIEVADFNDLLKRVEGYEVVMPVRTTFYGMKEISVKEPGGNVVCFAAKVK